MSELNPHHLNSPPPPRRWLPHPMLSLFMWLLWLLLVNDLTAGHLVLGGFMAWLIPYVTQSFWPRSSKLHKPLLALRLLIILLWDIVLASVNLAILILGPQKKLRPAFMELPLELENDFTIALLASALTLTPGSVAADLSNDSRTLLIHVLHVDDIEATLAGIKQRYEAPLKEIFECS